MSYLAIILSSLLSGGIVSIAVLRFTRRKAAAEAVLKETEVKTSELDNVQEAVKIWRETAESFREELKASQENFSKQVELLKKEVSRLTRIQAKIVILLDRITPENLENMVAQIKNEIHHENNG